MKHLKSSIFLSILCLSLASSQFALGGSVKPVKGIDVIVQKCCPTPSSSRQTATPNKDGTFTIQLSEPNTYTISYASGPKKGKVIETVTVTKAGSHTFKGIVSVVK